MQEVVVIEGKKQRSTRIVNALRHVISRIDGTNNGRWHRIVYTQVRSTMGCQKPWYFPKSVRPRGQGVFRVLLALTADFSSRLEYKVSHLLELQLPEASEFLLSSLQGLQAHAVDALGKYILPQSTARTWKNISSADILKMHTEKPSRRPRLNPCCVRENVHSSPQKRYISCREHVCIQTLHGEIIRQPMVIAR